MEGEREGPQIPFKADKFALYKEITDSADEKNKHAQRPKKPQIRQNVSPESSEIRREERAGKAGAGPGGVLRAGWQCLSLEGGHPAGGCSLWLFLQTS